MRPLIEETLNQMLEQTSRQFPGHCALSFGDQSWTYGQLQQRTDQIAAGLLASGVCKGDHVGILSENTPNAIFAFLGVIKAGCVACMLNTSLKAEELAELAALSDIRHLMIGSHYKDHIFYQISRDMARHCSLTHVFDIGQQPSSPYCSLGQLEQAGRQNMEAYQRQQALLTPEDDCLILYTSGTTGTHAKAVVSTHFHLVNGGIQKACAMNICQQDVICCALQLFHIFCIDVNILAAIAAGAELAMPDDLHSGSILKTLVHRSCTVLSSVPFTFRTILKNPAFSADPPVTLRTGIIGGAYCSPENFCKIQEAFGFTLLPGLGQTEATAGITVGYFSDSLETRSSTVGHFVDHSEGKIISLENGEPVPAGRTGEICIRSRLLMKGYYNRPDLTAQIIDPDGWLHTGDLGFLDADGSLHYMGRKKELINRGGEKIVPSQVEAALLQIPQIECCKVMGIPDPMLGEEVCACIVLRDGSILSADDIRQMLKDKLAAFKLPREILFFQAFPLNAAGKIQLNQLLEMVVERIAL